MSSPASSDWRCQIYGRGNVISDLRLYRLPQSVTMPRDGESGRKKKKKTKKKTPAFLTVVLSLNRGGSLN